MVKQVIVMRTDLKNKDGNKVRTGKLVAQGAHASVAVIIDRMKILRPFAFVRFTKDMMHWMRGHFTKICVGCKDEAELDALYKQAQDAGLPCSMIIDSGFTEFDGVLTKTCIAIGPADSKEIDKITGHMSLL